MTIAFTICSNNYLSQAIALADSLKQTNPEIDFTIGLLDQYEKVPNPIKADFERYPIIEISSEMVENFDWMHQHYDIVEFNTAVKPSFFQYLKKQKPKADKFIFLDPDIWVYQPLTHIEKSLDEHHIILTPHLTAPIADDPKKFFIHEPTILNHGIFNLGFVAIDHSEEAWRFIAWWKDRLAEYCKHDLCHGLFVDQLWCNLAPCFFDKVKIDKHPGMNFSYWNLQERQLTEKNGQYMVNEEFPLLFFHFSTFDLSIPDNIATKQNRYTLSQRPDLQKLYADYTEKVLANHYWELRAIPCALGRLPIPPKRYKRVRALAKKPFEKLIQFIEEI